MVATYRARRRIKLGPSSWREPGELIPEAHTWFRVGNWEHTGFVESVDIDEAELRKAISTYCDADTAKQVESLTGLDGTPVRKSPRPGYTPTRTSKQRKATKPEEPS